MIQFNLLPDVKKEYIRAKRIKRLLITISTFSATAAVGIILLFYSFVQIAQKKNIDDITKDINSEIDKLNKVNDLDKILTIQAQLSSLTSLHKDKPETSRLFDYLIQLTPSSVKITALELDFDNEILTIEGTAKFITEEEKDLSLSAVNQYADSLKFATYTVKAVDEGAEDETGNPFTRVLSSINRTEKATTYTIEMKFNTIIFDNTKEVTLLVPKQISTRSTTNKPNLDELENSLFEDKVEEEVE